MLHFTLELSMSMVFWMFVTAVLYVFDFRIVNVDGILNVCYYMYFTLKLSSSFKVCLIKCFL